MVPPLAGRGLAAPPLFARKKEVRGKEGEMQGIVEC